MKRIYLILALLLCVLPLSAVAGTKQSASINLSEPVVISGTHLQPGEFTVRWNGTGSDAQVQFLQGKKEIVSVPAKVITQSNPTSPAITMRSTQDGSKTISEIDLSTVTLQFPEKTESASK
jgi:plastocyanin domain-containing protein